jgi:NTE family protein
MPLRTTGFPPILSLKTASVYRPFFLLTCSICTFLIPGFFAVSNAQRVGVVLSGGGATALAHVGFLRALEEHDIPVDYIGGTSMGAVIAAMYASGYSAAQIDSMVHLPEFEQMATGQTDGQMRYYFSESERNAGMATIKYSNGGFITNALPTNLINPGFLDWKFMENYSQPDAASGNNFDSLYVPFRCIAADVEAKREVVFRNGPLNVAVRSSITYPFYLPPRRVNGRLLFDGGIYNNFPADMMYREFMPDVILGCNVSEDRLAPDEDDLFSQLQSLILFREEEQNLCDQMLVVKPDLDQVGTFDFSMIPEAVEAGYAASMERIGEIQDLVERRVTLEEKQAARMAFRSSFPPLVFNEVQLEGLDKSQNSYMRKLIGRKAGTFGLDEIRTPYFRIFSDHKIRSIYPVALYQPDQKAFRMLIDVRKEKDLFVSFGGNFSSRSINTGFVGLRYNLFARTAATLEANSYFGRFYGSIHAGIKWEISTRKRIPVALQACFTQNRWDFYRSLSFFFEDVKPSFILMNERVGTFSFTVPAGNKGILRADASYAYMFDEYYQTRQFLSVDTADRTDFSAGVFRITWERSTLNRRQFASKGTFINANVKLVTGEETTLPGSTSAVRDTVTATHSWLVARLSWQNYFFRRGKVHLGFLAEAVASNQPFFQNYISSAIAAPSFRPIPESHTYFLPQFRAHDFISGGVAAVLELGRNVDLRAEAYGFNAFGRILSDNAGMAVYDFSLKQFYVAGSTLVYHSPIGPMSVSANYYDQKEDPWSVLFNFGYILFNRSVRD